MNGQMTLMEMLGEIDPLKEVARTANVYWKQSRDKLKDLYSKDPDDYDWTCAVRHEYCPYEAQGRWGSGNGPNTVEGYYMNWQGVRIVYYDLCGKEKEMQRSWQDFAREIGLLIHGGEYA